MTETSKFVYRSLLLAVRESFIALLPFLLINALLALLPVLAYVVVPELAKTEAFVWFEGLSSTLARLFPLLAMLSLSFHLAKYLEISSIASATLSLCLLFSLHLHVVGNEFLTDYLVQVLNDPRIILTPILVAYVLKRLLLIDRLKLVRGTEISAYLQQHINLILPMVLTFILVFLLLRGVTGALALLAAPLLEWVTQLGPLGQIMFRVLLSHLMWCFGVHGDNAYLLVMGADNGTQSFAPNLSFIEFMDLFVLLGGSGATMSLLIAIFLERRHGQNRNLAKIAAPFSLVNINELLIYGLPIVFNPRMAIPFVLVPCLNVFIAWAAIQGGLITFEGMSFPWVTPIFLNGWIASGGFTVLVLQLMLLLIGVFVYRPFIRRYSVFADRQTFDRELIKRAELQLDIERLSELQYSRSQSESLAASRNLEKTVREVLSGELLVYYQPKLKLPEKKIIGFEALLRLKDVSGDVKGPWFIDAFQKAGYSYVIDRFVIATVAEDLARWRTMGFEPRISINVDPNNIGDVSLIDNLCTSLGEFAHQIDIEILESAFMRDPQGTNLAIVELQSKGFHFLLDDFGTGFSSLSLLTQIRVDGIKLDRSMLAKIDDQKGLMVYREVCRLCQLLGFILVAEGVESDAEADFVAAAGVGFVQGWLYGKAMPAEVAHDFAENFNRQSQ